MTLSLWDLKQREDPHVAPALCYYDTIPMGFETAPICWCKYPISHYDTIPMGFETADSECWLARDLIMTLSLWDLKLAEYNKNNLKPKIMTLSLWDLKQCWCDSYGCVCKIL